MKIDLKAVLRKQKTATAITEASQAIPKKKVKPKVHKLKFSEENITNTVKAFDCFESKVSKIVSKKEQVEPSSFFGELNIIVKKCISNNQLDFINKRSVKFAEQLVNLGNGRLAGIIYSLLIKANSENIKLVEQLATNGLAIAKRFHDPVHIMARCEDLRKIYNVTCPQSEKMLKVLYEEKRALNEITKNYGNAKNRFQTISKEMKPLENYQIMKGAIQIQIAKILKDSDPKAAISELNSAYNIINSVGKGKYTKEIGKLLEDIRNYQ